MFHASRGAPEGCLAPTVSVPGEPTEGEVKPTETEKGECGATDPAGPRSSSEDVVLTSSSVCLEPDKRAKLCQTWAVISSDGGDGLTDRVARELAECRIRGIDRLEVKNRHQDPVAARELGQLAAWYAAAQPTQISGRSAQIKDLLRAAVAELRKTNPTDAGLIHDLFFGDDQAPGRKYASDLLKRAQVRYGEPSEERFREIRNVAFRSFAEFLIEFVAIHTRPVVPVTSQPSSLLVREPADSSPMMGRRFVHSPLVAVLQFSALDPGDTEKPTIEEHQRIIAERGRCWWGWFKAAHDADHSMEIERRVQNCDIGLWERSENLFYVAHCDGARTANNYPFESPDEDLTPDYYRSQPYPAWFSFRSIRRSGQQEFAERFGDLPSAPSTIYWSPEPVPQPIIIQARGNDILHLSDLRFGQYHRWNTINVPNRTYMSAEQAIERTLTTRGTDLEAVGVVVICGNFSPENPTDEGFGEAIAFIDGLCEKLPNVSRDHVVIVPGADDFDRPGDRERAVQTLYREFHKSIYSGEEHDLSRMRRYEFDTFRLNVLPVNSVKMLGTDERDEGLFGYGYDAQLYMMQEDYDRHRGSTRVVNAVAAHHHIVSTLVKLPETMHHEASGARIMRGMHDARDVLSRLSASRVALYLHGHLHEGDCYAILSDNGWQTAICGAGTAGASDRWLRSAYLDNQGNSLALIKIADDGIRGSIFTYNEDYRYPPALYRQFQIIDQ